jgi:hypothetical protein
MLAFLQGKEAKDSTEATSTADLEEQMHQWQGNLVAAYEAGCQRTRCGVFLFYFD